MKKLKINNLIYTYFVILNVFVIIYYEPAVVHAPIH